MHPIFVDIENEFSEIASEAEGLSNRLIRLDAEGPLLDFQERWEATHVCASATEKIYTGCERVMARLASEIDGSPVSHSDGWHMALLRRMARPYPDLRQRSFQPNAMLFWISCGHSAIECAARMVFGWILTLSSREAARLFPRSPSSVMKSWHF
jgi:hypothetical protein